jgi:hypothetical protein
MPATLDSVTQGLRQLRRMRRQYWLASGAFVPLVSIVGGLAALAPIGRMPASAATLAIAIAWLGLINRLEQRLVVARCPRCGGLYHARRWRMFELRGVFLWSCQHCGLRLRADRHSRSDA